MMILGAIDYFVTCQYCKAWKAYS